MKYLSENTKTGFSINLPRTNCTMKTPNCDKHCYGRCGRMSLPSNLAKQIRMNTALASETDLPFIIEEARNVAALRLNGVGDLNKDHLPSIFKMAESCKFTQFYGMTRKPDIAKAINEASIPNLSILVSIDATSTKAVRNYEGAKVFGPREANDIVPDDDSIKVVFPYHHIGKVIKGIPEHEKDCPAVRKTVSGCLECGKCWSWRS